MSNPTATGGSADSIQVVLTFTNSSTVTPANTISLPESSSALFTVPGYTLASNSCTSGAAINNGSCTIIYALPSSVATTAFQSNLSRADFAYDYTYGSDLSGSSISNLATMIDVVMPTLAIESITSMAVGESSTATINWGNLYQATAPTTTTTAIESDGTSIVAGLSSATPATCGSVSSNSASCTSLITSTQSTPIKGGYLFNATAAGGVSATPKSFNVFSNNVIFATSGKWNGRLGGYSGADTKCNADANKPSGSSPGAGKTYKALLEGNNATTTDVIYYRTDGITQIATATGGDLVGYGSLLNKITTSIVASWTGYNGTNCTNWTYALSDVRGYSGASSSTTYTWWASSSQICSLTRTLYCVAQ
jgi:hypothetical protein